MDSGMPGVLYLVATPIGNLGDISARALQTLESVDFIAAEDTRVTRKLLERYKIKKPLVSYYEHNRRGSGEKILSRVLSGEDCALVSDSGTPAISDPGEDLVKTCALSGISVFTVPGPCAAISALALSGFSSGRFTFEGFLSTSRKSRHEHLNELKSEKRTMIFYEAPHKLMRTLVDMLDAFGDRSISISRELTKIHEETLRLKLSEAVTHFTQHPPRGEFVLVIQGAEDSPPPEADLSDAIENAKMSIASGLSVKDAIKKTAEESGIPKNALYKAVVKASRD